MNTIINYIIFNKIVLSIIYINKKTYIYRGNNCENAFVRNLFLLSKKNEIYIIYNNEILHYLLSNHHNLKITIKESYVVDNNLLSLTIEYNYKVIHLKHIKLFIKISIQQIYNIYNRTYVSHLYTENDKDKFLKKSLEDLDIFLKFLCDINRPLSQLSYDWKNYNSILKLSIILYKKYNTHAIELYTEPNIYNILKNYFFGARCELFSSGTVEDLYYIDFKSMYTNLLLEKYPFGHVVIKKDVSDITERGFYYIHGVSDLKLPILPMHIEGKTKYVCGLIEGLYWYEEINLFIKYGGTIIKIDYMISYENYDYIFRDYANCCLKNKSIDEFHKIIYKIIPNNFIGWFGAKNLDECRNIAYSIIVSSRGRIAWYKQYMNMLENNCTIFYSDTDSFFFKSDREFIDKIDKNIFHIKKFKSAIFFKKKKYTCIDDNIPLL